MYFEKQMRRTSICVKMGAGMCFPKPKGRVHDRGWGGG